MGQPWKMMKESNGGRVPRWQMDDQRLERPALRFYPLIPCLVARNVRKIKTHPKIERVVNVLRTATGIMILDDRLDVWRNPPPSTP